MSSLKQLCTEHIVTLGLGDHPDLSAVADDIAAECKRRSELRKFIHWFATSAFGDVEFWLTIYKLRGSTFAAQELDRMLAHPQRRVGSPNWHREDIDPDQLPVYEKYYEAFEWFIPYLEAGYDMDETTPPEERDANDKIILDRIDPNGERYTR